MIQNQDNNYSDYSNNLSVIGLSKDSHDSAAFLDDGAGSMSVSSTSSNAASSNNIIKNFKQTLSERHTPRNLIILNIIIALIILSTITLSLIDYVLLIQQVNTFNDLNTYSINSQIRTLMTVVMVGNARSLIDISTQFEFDNYALVDLNQYEDRMEYGDRELRDLWYVLQATEMSMA